MNPTKTLPENYHQYARIDLKENLKLGVALNLAGIPLFFAAGWVFLQIIAWLRPDAVLLWGILGGIWNLVIVLVGIFVIVILHEMVHGLFFWIYTRERPVFAFKLAYAYAAAPDWYLPRNQYLVIGLAPFFLLSLIAILLFAILPPYGVSLVLVLASFNVAGAVGDLAVCGWLLLKDPSLMINDAGDAAVIYSTGALSTNL